MAKPRKQIQEAFIDSLKSDPNVSLACDVAKISRDTAYRWRNDSQEFAQQWDNAVERTRDIARSSIYRRGVLGWDEPLVSMGQPVYEYEPVLDNQGEPVKDSKGKVKTRKVKLMIHKWSDAMASLYAKGNLSEYKDKPQVNIHAQLADLAEQAKNDLLADLEASLTNEDKN